MNLLDLIGFIFSLLLFLYLSLRRVKGKTQAQIDQEEEEYKEFLKTIGVEPEEEELKPLPQKIEKPVKAKKPPKPPKTQPPATTVARFESFVPAQGDAPVYETQIKESSSKVDKIINNTRSLKDMVILKEVLGPPKAYE